MYPKERTYFIKRKRHAENGWRSDGWAIYDFFSHSRFARANRAIANCYCWRHTGCMI